MYLNREILHRHGSAWWTAFILDGETFDPDDRNAAIAGITTYLATLPRVPVVVIKDPQIVPLAELWFGAARQAGFNVATVIAVRHPDEVCQSLRSTVVHVGPEHAGALWLKANLMAERNTRNVERRVFVDYTNLLDDWRREIKRISAALFIDLNGDDDTVDEFLTPDLHRQVHSGAVNDHFGSTWISTVYGVMHDASQDKPVNTNELDRIFEGYRATERDFRRAFEGERKISSNPLTQILRPLAKPITELLAIAHFHRGTWA